jgi:hypothetical protein
MWLCGKDEVHIIRTLTGVQKSSGRTGEAAATVVLGLLSLSSVSSNGLSAAKPTPGVHMIMLSFCY